MLGIQKYYYHRSLLFLLRSSPLSLTMRTEIHLFQTDGWMHFLTIFGLLIKFGMVLICRSCTKTTESNTIPNKAHQIIEINPRAINTPIKKEKFAYQILMDQFNSKQSHFQFFILWRLNLFYFEKIYCRKFSSHQMVIM